MTQEQIIDYLKERRKTQNQKWGANQTYPFVRENACWSRQMKKSDLKERACEDLGIPSETVAKQNVDYHARLGTLTWWDIIVEEVAEGASAGTDIELSNELIDIAATCMAALEDLHRTT